MKVIAHIKTDFKDKFGVPRQSGLIKSATGKIVFEKEYRDPSAIRGLEDFSHIWVLWEFSQVKSNTWSPTVRPPLLGGNKRMGVFATRSPYRPNAIGMSVLEIEGIEITEGEGPVIVVSGCDMIDNTPIFDIKPYLPYADSIPDAKAGFTENLEDRILEVEISQDMLDKIPEEKQKLLEEILKNDPRPSYQNDPTRVYGFEFCGFEVKFTVNAKLLKVVSVKSAESA